MCVYYNKIKKRREARKSLWMLKNNHKFENEEKKLQAVLSDDDSIVIEPQRKQMTTHTEFDIKYEEDEKKIVMYIELDPKSITNSTKEVNRGKIYDDERRFYKNCIFIKKIQTPESRIKGNFRITFLHYKGLTFIVQLKNSDHNSSDNQEVPVGELFSKMKMHYKSQQSWQIKWLNCSEGDEKMSGQFKFEVSPADVDKILKQKLLLQIFFQKSPKLSKDYRGIQNEGNTCYANSTLQVLYHFLPLRKMILQIPSKSLKKLTKSLQQIFVDLMTSDISVRAESLLNCFEKIQNLPHRQQDIHEFLISFFDQLEKELPEVAAFWTGKDYEVTSSKQVKYQSKQQQNFTQLQLFMADQKGNHFASISQSLMQLLQEDLADQPIDTDQFGKLTVHKSRFFQFLPPLLFMNIKRYEYNAKRRQLKKINLDLTYPKIINLDFLMKTQQGLDYVLYAVVVHKGRSPNSGHYFCFINVSKEVDKSNWYQFNDSSVRKVSEQKVLSNYTGKRKQEIYLNEEYGKWTEREQPSEETAYLLAYIHKDYFEQYQNLQVAIPSWQLQRLQQKITEEQSKTMTPVRIFVLRNEADFRPFEQSFEVQQVKLLKDELLESELKKVEKMLSCRVGSIWKVNCKTRTIKHIHKDYGEECRITVNRHTEQKRGIRQPDYFMIVPEQKMNGVDLNQHKKLGILHIEHLTQGETVETVEILPKEEILEKLLELRKSGANLQYDEDEYEYFVFGWNGYLRVCKS